MYYVVKMIDKETKKISSFDLINNPMYINTEMVINHYNCDFEIYHNTKLIYTFKGIEKPQLETTNKKNNNIVMEEFTTLDGVEYAINQLGVISQKNPKPFNYDNSYINIYNTEEYKQASKQLNQIRLSLLIGQYGKTPNNILDFGYGNGDFLEVAKDVIKLCSGYDIATDNNPPENTTKVNDFTGSYDVITFFDSLEHCKDIEFIKFLKTKAVLISLPYCKSPDDFQHFSDFKEWFSAWKHRKPNEHIHHFNPQSLELFLNVMGYKMGLICNLEDTIRKPINKDKNILTGFFWKQ